MGRPCTTCPGTTVQSCCGNRNLKVACILIGVFKLLFFASNLCVMISIMAGHSNNTDAEQKIAQQSIGHQLLVLFIIIGKLFLTAILLAGVFKKRRNYIMIYWAVNCVFLVLLIVGLFTSPGGVVQAIIIIIYIILDVYFQIVIRSYYLELGAVPPVPLEAPQQTTNRPRF